MLEMGQFDLGQFKIPIKGLVNKIYSFEFDIDRQFFEHYDKALIGECSIKVFVTFDKNISPYVLTFDISGTFLSDCDKCSAQINVPIMGNYTVYVEVSNRTESDNDEVIFISDYQDFIEIADMVNDFINLSIPIVKACDDPFNTPYCDKEVVKFLNRKEEKKENDSTWDQLKNIKL